MKRLMEWFEKNRLTTLLMATVFYLSVVVFHDEVTRLAIWSRAYLGVSGYNLFFTVVSGITLALFLYYTINQIRMKGRRMVKSIYLFVTSGLILLFYLTALVYNIEAVHFFQYMVLAVLLFPLLRSYGETVFWVTILGVLDELYQYTILTPFFRYFDFNDILLNLLGAGLGVVMIFICCEIPARRRRWYILPSVWFLSILVPLFALLILTGILLVYPEVPGVKGDAFILLNRDVAPSGFWTEAYRGRLYHIVRPGEGVVMMGGLVLFYHLLDCISQNPRDKSRG
jgi:hypothetical protein